MGQEQQRYALLIPKVRWIEKDKLGNTKLRVNLTHVELLVKQHKKEKKKTYQLMIMGTPMK